MSQGSSVVAQTAVNSGEFSSQILTIDSERLFSATLIGQTLAQKVERESAQIAQENREIEATLTQDELDLTEKRATLPPDEFRALANAFDERVQRLRREQDTKARALGSSLEQARTEFFAGAQPILAEIMKSAGAVVILERRSVFLSAASVDITDIAIAKIDEMTAIDGSTSTSGD